MMGTNRTASLLAAMLSCVVACSDEPACEGAACAQVCEQGAFEACVGSAAWAQPLSINVHGEPAVSPAGRIYISSAEIVGDLRQPRLTAFEPDGTRAWEADLGGTGFFAYPSRPVLAEEQVFVTVEDNLYAYDFDGTYQFVSIAPDGSENGVNYAFLAPPPTVSADGTVYWQFLAASRPDGTLLWRRFKRPDTECETVLPLDDGRVLSRLDDVIRAVDAQGDVVWEMERPNELVGRGNCVMIPYGPRTVATAWCEPGYSSFVCGHMLFIDVEAGEVVRHVEPPQLVHLVSGGLVDEQGALVLFSIGPAGNPEYRSMVWQIQPDYTVGTSYRLPFRGVYGAALGNDGLYYLATSLGLSAVRPDGEVQWTYTNEMQAGGISGAPAIGDNGCVYYESVQQFTRFDFLRELVCVSSGATGLASTPWPRTLGGNHSGLRPQLPAEG